MTSPYFNNYKATNEQELVESLVIESIHQWGMDVNYIHRQDNFPDKIFKEDSSATYTSATPLELYLKSYDGYEGNGEFLAKFGIEVRHQCLLTVAIKTFREMVGDALGILRPLEGDIIHFPMDNKMFVIQKVDKYGVFFQTGTLQSYNLVCEVFEYSSEKFATGVPEIDIIETELSLSTLKHALRDGLGELILDADGKPQFDPDFDMDDAMQDFGADNEEIDEEASILIDATDDNIMSEEF
jgi:hypothetical protein